MIHFIQLSMLCSRFMDIEIKTSSEFFEWRRSLGSMDEDEWILSHYLIFVGMKIRNFEF